MSSNKVLLYSGGMDSVILRHLWAPDTSVYVDLATAYSEAEKAQLPPDVIVFPFAQFSRFELPNKIIPFRNLMLCCIAAQFGDRIGLAATAGDRVLDKTPEFARLASQLFDYMAQPQWWLPEGRHITVELPVKHLTKVEMVKLYLAQDGDADALVRSMSCYYPTQTGQACWSCKPCFRKWVALVLNGIDVCPTMPEYIDRALIPNIHELFDGRSETEQQELRQALAYAGFEGLF